MVVNALLTPAEVDKLLKFPLGWSRNLARRGLLSHVKFPDGSVRFPELEIRRLVANGYTSAERKEAAHAS